MATTLKELALELGVTVPTVSRALRDSPRVKLQTRKRIQDLAAKRGYVANHIASGLKTNRSMTLGVLVPRIDESYWAEILEGIERGACRKQYAVLIGNTKDEDIGLVTNVRNMLQRRVDGIIRISHRREYPAAVLSQLQGRKLPMIDIDRDSPPQADCSVRLSFENEAGAQAAVRHLAGGLGHRTIGCLAGPISASHIARQRHDGFLAAMDSLGLPVAEGHVVEGGFAFEEALAPARQLLSSTQRPTAVVTCSDDAACAVYQVARDLGMSVPEQLSVVGFGNEKVAAQLPAALTTIDVPAVYAGELAFDRFIECRDGPGKPSMAIALPVNLVERASCAQPCE